MWGAWSGKDFYRPPHPTPYPRLKEAVMKEKIIRLDKGKGAVALPDEYLRDLELMPGSEVEVRLDKKKKWIIIRALHGTDFIEHFKDTMESMA